MKFYLTDQLCLGLVFADQQRLIGHVNVIFIWLHTPRYSIPISFTNLEDSPSLLQTPVSPDRILSFASFPSS
jgi:hypothetical protein